MMCRFIMCLGIVLLLSVRAFPQDDKQPVKLTQDDKDFFEQLFKIGLFDPKGAEWTALVPANQQARSSKYFYWKRGTEYFHTDGVGARVKLKAEQVPVPAKLEEYIRERFHPTPEQVDSRRRQEFGYPPRPPDLAFAAWAYRLGHEELAAEVLAITRKTPHQRGYTPQIAPSGTVEIHRLDLTWWAFVGMKNALESRDDELVVELYDKIQVHFKDDVVRHFSQGAEVLADIARRQKEGSLGKPAITALPANFEKWKLEEKTQFLIKQLEQHSSSFGDTSCEHELIKLGEDALPALFDCLEHDTRLTRAGIEGAIRHIANRERYSVREIAYDAVKRILKSIPQANIPYDAKRSKSELYRLWGAEAKKYWEANKGKPQVVRFYGSVCNLQGEHYNRADALKSLLASKQHRYVHLPDMNTSSFHWPDAPPQMREELNQFQKPTVAEAILRAMDHDLDKSPASMRAYDVSQLDRYLHSVQCCYLVALVYLGDRRVIPVLLEREAKEPEFHVRMKYAMALHKLGESKPLAKLATAMELGNEPKVAFSPIDRRTISDTWSIKTLAETAMVDILMSANLPETDRALMAFTKPSHPLYPYFASRFTYEHHHANRNFMKHPYCLSFLKKVLKDTTPTGSVFRVEKQSIVERHGGSTSSGGVQGELSDSAKRREQAEPCRCDIQMMRMRGVVLGLVDFHPLYLDAQKRFDRNMKWINTHTFRRITNYEVNQFKESSIPLIPVFTPLQRPATKRDVADMKAVFALEGDAKLVDIKLPAWIVLKKDVTAEDYVLRRGLILQAEELNGKKQYGVLYPYDLKTIKEDEVLRIEPYEPGK